MMPDRKSWSGAAAGLVLLLWFAAPAAAEPTIRVVSAPTTTCSAVVRSGTGGTSRLETCEFDARSTKLPPTPYSVTFTITPVYEEVLFNDPVVLTFSISKKVSGALEPFDIRLPGAGDVKLDGLLPAIPKRVQDLRYQSSATSISAARVWETMLWAHLSRVAVMRRSGNAMASTDVLRAALENLRDEACVVLARRAPTAAAVYESITTNVMGVCGPVPVEVADAGMIDSFNARSALLTAQQESGRWVLPESEQLLSSARLFQASRGVRTGQLSDVDRLGAVVARDPRRSRELKM